MDRKVADVRARQGWRGRPVLTILVVSLLLAGVAMVFFLGWVGDTSPGTGTGAGTEAGTNTTGSTTDEPMEMPDPPLSSPANESNPAPTAN